MTIYVNHGSAIEADVSSADIELGDLSIRTGSGDVDLELEHPLADLRFELSAGSGDQSYTTED